jgi:diguanylate cyclase (GGDEF)-like protein/PAS domain S-box-containing protein
MRLARLSRNLERLTALGVVILLVLAAMGLYNLHQEREELSGLYALQSDINSFSAASDSLLVLGADPGLWRAYRDSADDIQARLRELGRTYPDALKAADQIETMVRSLERARVTDEASMQTDGDAGIGPLELPPRARMLLTQVAGHGIALDSVVARAIRERRTALADSGLSIVGAFAVAAILFALSSFAALRFLHLRLRDPVTRLQQTIDAVDAGDLSARVHVNTKDELGHLGRAFNRMLEGRVEAEEKERQHHVEAERQARRASTILESITDAFFALDPDWCFTYVNQQAEVMLESSRDELLGNRVWQLFPGLVGTNIEHEYRRAMTEWVTVALEEYYEPLGRWFDIRAYPSSEGLAVYFRDITERHELLEQLRSQQVSLRDSRDELSHLLETRQALINSLPAHIALLDAEANVIDVNNQWRHYGLENTYGGNDDYGVGRNYLSICDQAMGSYAREAAEVARGIRAVLSGYRSSFALEYPCHAPDQPRWFRVMVNSLAGRTEAERDLGAVVMHVDITERKLAEQELNRLAYEDPLTGLYARNGFIGELEDELRNAWQPAACVVMLDLVRVRDINESYGFAVGDQLLAAVGERLESVCDDPAPLVGRTGGDEFIVYLPAQSAEEAERLRARMSSLLDKDFVLGGTELRVGARFGYTELAERTRSIESIVREAEIALYSVVEEGGASKWGGYTEERDEQTRNRVAIAAELRTALQRNEFELHYQPKVSLRDGAVIGAEALIRWNHPERGLESPGLFIPIAEQSQLIGPIGDWALDEACRSLRAWQDEGLMVQRLAVNVSLVQFALGNFAETVRDALARHDVNPGDLTLEITESVFEHESGELLRQLSAIDEMGVQLSLDDFGTGYSSLRYLQRYPFDEIKVDKSFVFNMLNDPYSSEVVNTVLGIAGALDASTVAEGIEDLSTANALREAGCRVGQGFYYSKPLEPDAFRQLMQDGGKLPSAESR